MSKSKPKRISITEFTKRFPLKMTVGIIWSKCVGLKVLSALNAAARGIAFFPMACISVMSAIVRLLSLLVPSCTAAI